ncbi:hypothetical protein BO70DRAFT_111935 [Aspergillus heteromorphus CBS 117.55]|uniref:Uncharacterized protein n=1 Tax=Aspergillus heteromorphus CBS 117.55 TaxID=1448321 RepID=A0A317VII6_9EURO|nr:uncharacterized protein BO70DRAFT_111935 [Aspergillus heteromorphus CBS 117.55]PWY73725.1 hypothetical protein BO70DRAFT_111935 [Aspergillus heteromorphus CBS 117.55]
MAKTNDWTEQAPSRLDLRPDDEIGGHSSWRVWRSASSRWIRIQVWVIYDTIPMRFPGRAKEGRSDGCWILASPAPTVALSWSLLLLPLSLSLSHFLPHTPPFLRLFHRPSLIRARVHPSPKIHLSTFLTPPPPRTSFPIQLLTYHVRPYKRGPLPTFLSWLRMTALGRRQKEDATNATILPPMRSMIDRTYIRPLI